MYYVGKVDPNAPWYHRAMISWAACVGGCYAPLIPVAELIALGFLPVAPRGVVYYDAMLHYPLADGRAILARPVFPTRSYGAPTADDNTPRGYKVEITGAERCYYHAVIGDGTYGAECVPTAEQGNTCHSSVSGYSMEPAWLAHRMIDGAYIEDHRPCKDRPDFVRLVVNSPMVGHGLQPGEVDRCPMPSDVLLTGLSGEFQLLAAKRATDPTFNGLDSVHPDAHAEYWRKAGAVIYRRQGDNLVNLTTGEVTAILPYWN